MRSVAGMCFRYETAALALALGSTFACATPRASSGEAATEPAVHGEPRASAAASVAALTPPSPPPPPPPPPPPLRIAFGSCSDLRKPARLWELIAASEPDVWLWLGDNVYADTEDMTRMAQLYAELHAFPGYARVRERARVIGTWDDHDFGKDNAGREYPMRAEAQQRLLDFLDEPQHSPRRKQAGVYAAYDFGAPPYQVRVIVLDTRYHRDPLRSGGDVLGEAQWAWLEGRLRGSPAAVHVIASSIQVLADDHAHEKWANFPAARARLLALLNDSAARNPVILSGDRHFAELTQALLPRGRVLYDLTSSSLSRPFSRPVESPNHERVGEPFGDVNFGLMVVDFRAGGPAVRLEVHSDQGRTPITLEIAGE
jgi:alkaline phosphatase D